jgi:hypothetical protein
MRHSDLRTACDLRDAFIKKRNAGSLHCAADDETVRRFGRDDDCSNWMKNSGKTKADSSAALRNDNKKALRNGNKGQQSDTKKALRSYNKRRFRFSCFGCLRDQSISLRVR